MSVLLTCKQNQRFQKQACAQVLHFVIKTQELLLVKKIFVKKHNMPTYRHDSVLCTRLRVGQTALHMNCVWLILQFPNEVVYL